MTMTEEDREAFEFPHADIVDTRDLHDLLEQMRVGDDLDETEARLLVELEELTSIEDWQWGEALIADHYFEDHARQMADDIGAVNSDGGWPTYCIDWQWAARELQMDYTPFVIDGRTYWAR